jgi:ADP-ribosyl-[dinitrogen reductase] hydrolase
VNLIEYHEMVDLQVENTAQRVPDGIDYIRLPIPDFGVPDQQWESNWQSAGPVLQEHLRRGRAVLLHCKGGLGRTGLVAARILIELGFTADTAIITVRAARTGAIETRAQEQYIKNLV